MHEETEDSNRMNHNKSNRGGQGEKEADQRLRSWSAGGFWPVQESVKPGLQKVHPRRSQSIAKEKKAFQEPSLQLP